MDSLNNAPENARGWLSTLPNALREALKKRGVTPQSVGSALESESPAERKNRTERRARAAARRKKTTAEQKDIRQREVEARAAARRRKADSVRVKSVLARLAAAGVKAPDELRSMPRPVVEMVRAILADPSGGAWRYYAESVHQRQPVAVGAIRAAALVPDEAQPGVTRYSWADARARKIGALGLALLRLGRHVPRAGHAHLGDGLVVVGYTVGFLRHLLSCPWTGRAPSKSALDGTHRRNGGLHDGQCGYLVALRLAGFFRRYQASWDSAQPCERWETRRGRYTSNRYHLVTPFFTRIADPDVRERAQRYLDDAYRRAVLEPLRSLGRRATISPYEPPAAPS